MRTIPENDHRTFQSPSTWVPLFEVDAGASTLYLTPCPTEITVDGHTYSPFPIMLEELVDDGKGEISTVQLICSDIEGTLSTALKGTGSIDGNNVIFRIYSVQLEDIVYEESLEIISCGPMTAQSITFELGMFNPFTVKLLQEKFLKDFCWNRYKSAGCWILQSDGTYAAPAAFTAGSPDTCTHKLDDCIRHNNVIRINTFPGIPGGGGFV